LKSTARLAEKENKIIEKKIVLTIYNQHQLPAHTIQKVIFDRHVRQGQKSIFYFSS